MYPVSQTFVAAAMAGDQQAVSKASVYLGDDVLGELAITDGSVTADATSDGALRSLTLNVAPDPDAWDWVVAAGAEIHVWRGFALPGGDELAPLGVFVVDADPDQDVDTGAITISAADRSRRISRAGWLDPYSVAVGTDVGNVIVDMLRKCWAACPVGFGPIGKSVGTSSTFQAGASSDPWKDARAIALTAGYDLYFDAGGIAQLRLVPDPATTDPCVVYRDGETGIITDSKRVALLSQVYNGVVAEAEGSGLAAPLRGECWDEDPTSPTYRYGPLGQVPYWYSSPLLTTQSEVDSAARTTYARIKGRADQMSWSMVPNPALEPSDVVERAAIDDTRTRYMIDVLTTPLYNASMTVTARKALVV